MQARASVDREKVARLLKSGMRQTDIAIECGVSPKTVTFIKQEMLGLREPPNGRTGRLPSIDRDKARELLASGMPSIDVAARLGCRPSAIPDLKRELGFPVAAFRKRQGNATSNNPGGIRMARQSRAQSLKQGNHPRALSGTAQHEARRRAVGIAPNIQPRSVPLAPLPLFDLDQPQKSSTECSPASKPVPFHALGRSQCQWFVGPITKGHAHEANCCGQKTVPGRAYCASHCEKSADKRKTEESRASTPIDLVTPWSQAARRAAE